MEQKFCQLSEFVQLKKLRLLIKSKYWFKQDLGEFTYADLTSNFNFRGYLRSIWPQKSHNSWFSFKYHIKIAFVLLRLFTGNFAIEIILLIKQGFIISASVLKRGLRLGRLYWGRIDGHGPRQLLYRAQ